MLSTQALEELKTICRDDDLTFGRVFNLLEAGVTNNKEIVARDGGGNTGAVGINRQIIDAIISRKIPNSSSIATHAWRTVNRLHKDNSPVSKELAEYFDALVSDLKAKSLDETAIQQSAQEVEKESKTLEQLLAGISNAIYVYSYPTYLRAGTVENPDLTWFKIGYTDNEVGTRILSQARQTAMPEDPVIVRVYHKAGVSAQELETKFHQTLDVFKQQRSARTNQKSGKEWFATGVDQLDQIARLLELKIES